MKLVRLFALICLLFALPVTVELDASTLHVVLVGDTLDRSIGFSVKEDLMQIEGLMSEVASKADMQLNLTVLKGNQVRPQRVLTLLRGLTVGPDDALFFYFSGHGYRTVDKGDNIWPMLYFSLVDRGTDFATFNQVLIDKNPRMLLSIADSCNNVVPDYQAPPIVTRGVVLKAKTPNFLERANMRKLFAESRGYYLVSSSIPGQYAWSLSSGGLFTLALLDVLREEFVETDTSWEYIFTRAIESVVVSTIEYGSGVQIPQFLSIPLE